MCNYGIINVFVGHLSYRWNITIIFDYVVPNTRETISHFDELVSWKKEDVTPTEEYFMSQQVPFVENSAQWVPYSSPTDHQRLTFVLSKFVSSKTNTVKFGTLQWMLTTNEIIVHLFLAVTC